MKQTDRISPVSIIMYIVIMILLFIPATRTILVDLMIQFSEGLAAIKG